ncbi:hypothetical protein GQ53DRAFT_801926 [Thozetella sp. PMI_491]|nr:hypothetical protein GQ53DRAFT_801926 [Thozetella sp. PMI_491]
MNAARNAPNAPLSPISLGGSEWSYPPMENDGPYPNNRGQLISPPNSGGSAPMNGFPPGPRSAGGPSPPPSVGRSSTATNLYARSESGRSQREENQEVILGEHYVSLKRFLSATSRDGKPNPPPNKARDKLQRLTGVQFLELSTDVFDELKRRESVGRRPANGNGANSPPPYLLPEDNFHPKRNQARQKLSSLGPPRFRDLATDVFCELERRYPRFVEGDIPRVGSPMSVRGPSSRSQTPVNGNGFPPRGPSRVRRPSEASSIRSVRAGPMNGAYGNSVPPSPGLPGDYGRPMAKQFQSNTIVPNKSTMVEEDDDLLSPTSPRNREDGFAVKEIPNNRGTNQSDSSDRNPPSETDKKLIEEYEGQVRELRGKLDEMEDDMKKKQDEMNGMLDGERSRATAANMERKEWTDARLNLENQLAEAQNFNDTLQRQLDNIRNEHANEVRALRDQIEDARQSAPAPGGQANPELVRENQELRMSLKEQQQVTEEVRREAQEFLREMRVLSQQSGSAWEKQSELEKTIETLESEVRDWRNRYAQTKTQLRNMRASSLGLTIEQDAAKYVREKGFTQENGLVKDVHVTKFQIAIDELLQRARVDDPEKVVDSMKAVVVSVRRITKDIDESAPGDEGLMQQQAKLKGRVSSTANNLITASKNFAAAAGISPVSLLDAAASHLVAAVVELLRTVKIRATPAGELEDDDDGTMTPVDSTGFFSPRSRAESQSQISSAVSTAISTQDSLPPPPPFQGLGGNRGSADSSAYSPISSPRESYSSRRPASRGGPLTNGTNGGYNGMAYMGMNKNLPNAPNGGGYGGRQQQTARVEDFRVYLQDQSAILVDTIQNLVQLIRNDASINQVTDEINVITDVVGKVVVESESFGPSGAALVERLASCRQRLLEAGDRGMDLAAEGKDPKSREWRMWTQTLPPIAFEIAKETKGLVQRADDLLTSDGADDFA